QANADGLPMLSRDVKNDLKPALQRLVSLLRAKELDIWSATLELQTLLDTRRDEVKALHYQVEQAHAEFQRHDAQRMERKLRLEEDLKRKLDQLEALQKEVQFRRSQLSQRQQQR